MLCVAKRAKNAIVMFDMQKITYIRYFVTTFQIYVICASAQPLIFD